MSLGVSSSYAFNINGLDLAHVNSVTKKIFSQQNSSSIANLDYSKFNRASIGTDLYSVKTPNQIATQISVANSGYQVQLTQNTINSLNYLNSQAAKTQNISKNVEGKLTTPLSEGSVTQSREVFVLPKSSTVDNSKSLDKDKRGTNPFSFTSNNVTETKTSDDDSPEFGSLTFNNSDISFEKTLFLMA